MIKSKCSLSNLINRSSCVLIALLLGACDNQVPVEITPQTYANQLTEVVDAKINSVTPEHVAETFALGSHSTDLQRDILTKELVGSVVEWDIKVYEIEYAEGIYKITSQPFAVKSEEAINLMRASISLSSRSDQDQELLRKAKTNDTIRIRGKVQAVMLRAVVMIDPAILVFETK
jgi:hypothetical protein